MAFPYGRKRRRSTHEDDDPASDASKPRTLNDDSYGDAQETFSHDDYTVGWICALPIEMAAAKAMFDKVHQTLPPSKNDDNAYTLGSIGAHKIAIACLPSGHYGNNNAASVGSNLRRTFPSIRLSLMVGIGGGAPGRVDIRLGDVVVSDRVVQYDLGKTVGEGHFTRTGAVRSPPRELLTAVAKLRADHDLEPSRVPLFLSEMPRRYPSMSSYLQNNELQDQLFDGQYDHVASSVDGCQGCDKSRLVNRSIRSDAHPKIHYGVVASGNQVIEHGRTRDKIAQELDAICFEMEAAGLMDSVPGLVIRGICDYSDTHKNKRWQKVAAAAAAAYAKELLLDIPAQTVKTMPAVQESLNDTDRRQALLSCLKFEQIDSRRSAITAKYGTTCQWLLVHPDYVDWLDPSKAAEHHGFLWIDGNPGTGKSTIMNFACTQAAKDKKRVVISFFFNARGDDIEKSTAGMYRSLLFQLLSRLPSLLDVFDNPEHKDALDDMYTAVERQGRLSEWPATLLQGLLRIGILRLHREWLTIFVDALDECGRSQIEEMIEFFEELGKSAALNGHRLTICFSSRHYPLIEIQYGRRLTLEREEGHEQDIAMYINSKLKIGTSLTAKEIKDTLQTKSCRIFMWVVLVVDILKAEYRDGRIFDVKKRLDILPTKLNDLFKEILLRDQNNLDDLRLCIQWLLFAKRPLRLEEYYFASVSGLNQSELRQWNAEEVTRDDMKRFVSSSSKGLAETSKASIVQFIHESVREFFLEEGLQHLWPNVAEPDFQSISQWRLHQCCRTYLRLDIPDLSSSMDYSPNYVKKLQDQLLRRFPFLEYAMRYIFDHVEALKGADSPALQQEFLTNFDLKTWIRLNNMLERFKLRRYKGNTSIMYILAEKNLPRLITVATPLCGKVGGDENRYHYPLFAALANDSRDAVRALLQNGTEELSTTMFGDLEYGRSLKVPRGQTPPSWAARNGHEAILQHLLQRGEDFDTYDEHFASLIVATSRGHSGIVQLLISRGAYANSMKMNLYWPMVSAAQNGQESIIRLLLGMSKISSKCINAALVSAASMGFESCVRLLLEGGADVNVHQSHEPTPTVAQDKAIAQLLFNNGKNDNNHAIPKTPLFAAIRSGKEAMVKLLLENGADVAVPKDGSPRPLYIAAKNGHEAIVQLLLDHGADADEPTSPTALHAAAKHGHEAVVRLLLIYGANVNTYDKSKRTPLHWAAAHSHEAIVRLFLESGAEIRAKDPFRSPLYIAAEVGNMAIVRLLLDNGIDVDGLSLNQKTPLCIAASRGREDVVRALLKNGAEIQGKDPFKSPLHFAVRAKDTAIVRLLLQHGADVDAPDIDCKTPLCSAASRRHEDMVRMLLENGAQIHGKHPFKSPLFFAIRAGNTANAQLLLENGADADGPAIPKALAQAPEKKRKKVSQLLEAHRGQS